MLPAKVTFAGQLSYERKRGGGGVCTVCIICQPHITCHQRRTFLTQPVRIPRAPQLRLTMEETGFQPLPQTASFDSVSAATLQSAPRLSQNGLFGSFTTDASCTGWSWVVLPQWRALVMAKKPVAVPVADCSAVPTIMAAAKATTDDDKKRMKVRHRHAGR